jgi:hypothetical protein
VNVVAAVQAGIVDQALPAGHRARLLEVDPHHDQQVVLEGVPDRGQPARVIKGGDRIVDRAGANDDQQAVVGHVHDGAHIGPALLNGVSSRPPERKLLQQRGRREQRFVAQDARITGLVGHHVSFLQDRRPCPGSQSART